MAVYYDNTSLKAKHERKRSLEELTKENKELKTRLHSILPRSAVSGSRFGI